MIQPFMDRVLVRRLTQEKSAGGILFSEEAQKALYKAVVLETGPLVGQKLTQALIDAGWCPDEARTTVSQQVPQPGDVVYFSMWSGNKLTELDFVGGQGELKDMILLAEPDVLAKVVADEGQTVAGGPKGDEND